MKFTDWLTPDNVRGAPDPDGVPGEIPRDHYGRPLLPQQDKSGVWSDVPFTRASTVAGAYEVTRALMDWDARAVAAGMAARPDLCREVAALTASGPDALTDPAVRAGVNAAVQMAREVAGGRKAARHGSCVHTMADPAREGRSMPTTVDTVGDTAVRADVTALRKMLTECRIRQLPQAEIFVANQHMRVAGSIDGLFALPSGRVVVGDIKTGRHRHIVQWCIQLTAYATSMRYTHDVTTPPGTRWTPIHPDIDKSMALVFAPNVSTKPYVINTSPGLLGLACTAHRASSMRGAREMGICAEYDVTDYDV